MKPHHRLGAWLLALVPVGGILVGVAASPVLRIERITIVAPTASLGAEVSRQLSLPAEASMLLLPLNRVVEQVQQCYRVQTVSVERIPPHELRVCVTAREPFAALRDGEGYTLMSRDGIYLCRQARRPELPVFVGLGPSRPPLGSRLEDEKLRWALDLLLGATKVGKRATLQSDFTQPHHITVTTGEGYRGVLGNVNSLSRKMTILGRVAVQLQREGRRPVLIDVSIPEAPRWTTA